MVPLGTGVAYCAGDEWSEVLTEDDVTTVNGSGSYVFLPSDYEAPVKIIERFSSVERLLLSWLEAMSSLVCQHCIFCKIYLCQHFISCTIYLCQHFISCTIYHLLQNILAAINFIIGDRLQLANGDLSTVP